MSILDTFTNIFKFNGDDDLDDYEDDYDEFEDDYEEEEEKPARKMKVFGSSKSNDDYDDEESGASSFNLKSKAVKKNNVVPMKTSAPRGLEVVVIRPETMDDAKEITDTLLIGKAVVLNLEGINVDIAQRIIDYSAGSTYAIRGNLQKITSYIFLVTPPNVDISGDIPEIVTGGIDLSSFKSEF